MRHDFGDLVLQGRSVSDACAPRCVPAWQRAPHAAVRSQLTNLCSTRAYSRLPAQAQVEYSSNPCSSSVGPSIRGRHACSAHQNVEKQKCTLQIRCTLQGHELKHTRACRTRIAHMHAHANRLTRWARPAPLEPQLSVYGPNRGSRAWGGVCLFAALFSTYALFVSLLRSTCSELCVSVCCG